MIPEIEKEFLLESNAIEGVFDHTSFLQARYAWEYLKSQKEMSSHVVLKTHKILMLKQPLQPDEKGYFRKVPVYIGGHQALNHSAVKERMHIWCLNAFIHPQYWKEHHVEYEKIHPFVDGNGRTGRMFMNWERLKAGLPILVIKADERHEYYKWFA